MAKKIKCDHTIGYVESHGYDGDIITNFIHLSEIDLSTAKELTSYDGSLFNYCHNCGKKLEGLLDKKVAVLTEEKNKRNEEERIKKEKSEIKFQEKVLAESVNTKLNQLPEEGNFIVVFNPTKSSYSKNVVIHGPKDLILRNCVLYNSNKSNPDQLIVKEIYKTLTQEQLEEVLLPDGWTVIGTSYKSFQKTVDRDTKTLSIESSGMVYVTKKHIDEDGDEGTSYDHFTLNRLSDYVGLTIPLETITLK